MDTPEQQIADVAVLLKERAAGPGDAASILNAPELKALYAQIPQLPNDQRAQFGQAINQLKSELEEILASKQESTEQLPAIDVTAPFDVNVPANSQPKLLTADVGSVHPLTAEQDIMLDIFNRMGFSTIESRQIDDDYHMFGSLNFPEGHPARDEMDTFLLNETDAKGKPLVAPAHTSIMQNRVMRDNLHLLDQGEPIAFVVPGRVYRNEDLDARHEHTFYQIEGIYVGQNVTVGNLLSTLQTFMESYYGKTLKVKTQPFYFPFTEPSLEFAQSCPFCDQKGCAVCSHSGWIELLGSGMIHPNVLKQAGVDTSKYTGFAFGLGFMRMVMIKYGIEDIRHLESGRLEFLRQFA